jgi:hypothetical protein
MHATSLPPQGGASSGIAIELLSQGTAESAAIGVCNTTSMEKTPNMAISIRITRD